MAEISKFPGASLPGFDPRWRKPADFVLGVTWDGCEGRNLTSILDHYVSDTILHGPGRVLNGAKAIRADAMSALAEFPNRELLPEDVIACDTLAKDGTPPGFHASLRTMVTGNHFGNGPYGNATGSKIQARAITDFWCAEDQVREVWRIEDTAAIARQLGLDPRAHAERMIVLEGGPDRCERPLSPENDPEGPYFGRGNRSAPGEELQSLLKDIMSGSFSAITDSYDRACELNYPGGAYRLGPREADRFWLGLRAAFPSAAFRIEHVTGREEDRHMPRAALRWSLYGKHDGPGPFGPPTGCFVYVMGITHAEFGPRGLRREWTLIDECAIWKQIALATGAI